jgi:hypothetical protein
LVKGSFLNYKINQFLMRAICRYKRAITIYMLIVSALFLFSKCVNDQSKQRPGIADTATALQHDTVEFSQFAGQAVCAKCHAAIANDYTHTAHFLSSQEASSSSIKGSFKKGRNGFRYDTDKIVSLEKQYDSFYQVYYHKGQRSCKKKI